MASINVFKTGDHELNPNSTGHWWRNNAAPSNAVWSAQAIPGGTANSQMGFAQDTSLEVKRVWRRMIITEKKPFPQSQTVETALEHEIHYEVTNLTNTKVRFEVLLCAIAP